MVRLNDERVSSNRATTKQVAVLNNTCEVKERKRSVVSRK